MNLRRKIFEFIVDHKTRWNYVPTRGEIHKMFAPFSDDIDLHLEQLAREGLLVVPAGGGQNISLSPTFELAPTLNLQHSRLQQADTLLQTGRPATISLDLRGVGIEMEANMYVMQVPDDSMIDGDLLKGDLAIMTNAPPTRGDIVAVDMDETTVLRRFIHIQSIPHILAENPIRPELLYAYDLPFRGVLWGLIRLRQNHRLLPALPRAWFKYSDPILLKSESGKIGIPSVAKRVKAPAAGHRLFGKAEKMGVTPAKRRLTPPNGTPRSEAQTDWPRPPSGVELNDMACPEYGSGGKLLDDDQRKYGWALEEALRNYEKKEAKWR